MVTNQSNVCVFCCRQLRRRNGHKQNLTRVGSSDLKNRILEILKLQGEQEKADRTETAQQLFYHKTCLTELDYKLIESPKKANKQKGQTKWAENRTIHSLVFSKIKKFVTDELIEMREIRALTDIHFMYSALFEEEKVKLAPGSIESKYTAQHLLKKLLDSIPNLKKNVYMNRTFLYRDDLTESEIFSKGFQRQDDFADQMKTVAYSLRQTILNSKKQDLPKHNINVSDIVTGESDIPQELYRFVECLLKGPSQDTPSETKTKRIESICNSIIFSATNGSIKPSSCIQLGLATKSMTGNRKLLNVLNRMGHCISYTLTQEIETELAYGCSIAKRSLPFGLELQRPELHTHVAFDNYDRFVETSSGKNTLHDTVGIVYQNKSHESHSISPITANTSVETFSTCSLTANDSDDIPGSRRRKYVSKFNSYVEPYARQSQHRLCLVGNTPNIPQSLQVATNLNTIWMMNHAYVTSGAKRWFLWNSVRVTDSNPIHNIGYLPNLNSSPTSDATVKKTMEIALDICRDCNQQYIIVTYDLAIAMKAYRIQKDMEPRLNNVFIMLGGFHIQLSFFKVSKALYRFIEIKISRCFALLNDHHNKRSSDQYL